MIASQFSERFLFYECTQLAGMVDDSPNETNPGVGVGDMIAP